MKRSHQEKVVMDPLTLRTHLQAILDVEIPRFIANIRPTPLPIIDMVESPSAQTINASSGISTYFSPSNVAGLRKFSSDLAREIKALEKVLVPKFLYPISRSPHFHTRCDHKCMVILVFLFVIPHFWSDPGASND